MSKIVLTIRGCTRRLNRFELWLKRRCEKTSWYALITLLILTAFMLGCSRPSKPVSDAAGRSDDVLVQLWVSSDCVQPGEVVKIRVTVTDTSALNQVIESSDQPVLDIVFGNPDHPFLRWSDGKPLTSDLTRFELKPGESKSIEMDWVPDSSFQGPVHIWARFVSPTRPYLQNPSVTVAVKYCTGPLDP